MRSSRVVDVLCTHRFDYSQATLEILLFANSSYTILHVAHMCRPIYLLIFIYMSVHRVYACVCI
jgi:hypothetical protein